MLRGEGGVGIIKAVVIIGLVVRLSNNGYPTVANLITMASLYLGLLSVSM